MKINTQNTDFHSGGTVLDIEYKVANTPKMMEILSSGIYSDKISAVIRELSMNAVEAHQDADNKNPYVVTLPTLNNLMFKIRDYGTGLSLADFKKLYTTYGISTKDERNDRTGCLGLGSKSPFAYTDSFITISYFNGQKITIQNTKNAQGVPSCIVLAVENTTEPNGLEVFFDVDRNDCNLFKSKAEAIYRYFDVENRPATNITLEYKVVKPILEGLDWEITGEDNIAIMGQIAYPISKYEISSKYDKLLDAGVSLYFEIGEVNMSVSRESLEMTQETIALIESKLEQIVGVVVKHIESKVDSAKNLFEAAVELNKIRNTKLYSVVSGRTIKWKNQDIVYSYDSSKLRGFSLSKYYRQYNRNRQQTHMVALYIDENTEIFYIDKKGYLQIAKDLRFSGKHVYILNDASKKDDLAKLIGLDEIKPISSLPKTPSVKTTRAKPTGTYKFQQKSSLNKADFWVREKIDEKNEKGVWVAIDNANINGKIHPAKLNEFLSKMTTNPPTIVGVLKSRTNDFKNNPNWTPLEEWIKEYVEKQLDDDYSFYIDNRDEIRQLAYSPYEEILSSLYKVTKKSIFHEVGSLRPSSKMMKKFDEFEQMLNIALLFAKVKTNKSTKKIPDYKSKYPLLKYLRYAKNQEIIDYVNLIGA